MKYLLSIGALLLAIHVVPDAARKCADPDWQFNTMVTGREEEAGESLTSAHEEAARTAKREFCQSVLYSNLSFFNS